MRNNTGWRVPDGLAGAAQPSGGPGAAGAGAVLCSFSLVGTGYLEQLVFNGAMEMSRPWLVQFCSFLKAWSRWRNQRGNWMQTDNFVSISVELQAGLKFHSENTQQPSTSCTSTRIGFFAWVHRAVLALGCRLTALASMGKKKQTNKPKNFTKCRTIILLKSGGSSHFYCHWFATPVVLLWCFCFKGYKLESWWELPSPCDGRAHCSNFHWP